MKPVALRSKVVMGMLVARLALGMTAAVALAALTGCSKSSTPPAAGTAATPAPVVAAAEPQAADSIRVPQVAPAESTPDVPETTETGTTTQAGPALALKIAEVKADPSSVWKEGEHYLRLSPTRPTSALPGQVEVTEFFWYGCPHCYALDRYVEAWRKSKPAYVSFIRVPVLWSPAQGLHARIYYTAQALDKLDALHGVVFDEFHKNHHPLTTPDMVGDLFTQHGVDNATFKKAFVSPSVEASLSSAQQLGVRYQIDSVPTITINGKYLTDVSKAGGPDKLFLLINHLVAREHGASI